eukprot:gene20794-27623_t
MDFPGPYVEPATPRAGAKDANGFGWSPLQKGELSRRMSAGNIRLAPSRQGMDSTRSSKHSLSPALEVRTCTRCGSGFLPGALALAMASGSKISSSCCPSNSLPSKMAFALPKDSSYFSPCVNNSFHNSCGDQIDSSALPAFHHSTWAGHDSSIDTWDPISGRLASNSDCGDDISPSEPFLGLHLRVNAPRPRA